MPINTDLSVSPYFDDFSEDKNFYRVLFKPGTAVQVRELNQLQTILQNQIEKFGNNVYKRGTIIDGVNFIYYPDYPYIKINDSQVDGVPAAPSLYVGHFAIDPTTNLIAHVINSADGYEATDPNLKTLYLKYINSGDSGEESSFTPGSTIKIYDYLDSMNQVIINNGSSGFANNDTVVFCSAIAVNVSSSNSFIVGETITQSGNTHFAIIDDIDTVKGQTVLKLRPRQTDLTNTQIAASIWQFDDNTDIIGNTSGATATVIETIGSQAVATLITTADVGRITEIKVTQQGTGYYVAPYVTIKSSGTNNNVGERNYTDLDLVGRNYIGQVVVSTKTNSVGNGYAFGVTSGIIYQKGYFLHVDDQTIVVSKYSGEPDSLSVGFDSTENIIDSNQDASLLDNSTGTRNQFAPGADRLQLIPKLVVVTSDEAEANTEFFSIVDFSDGFPYLENKTTQFNVIEDEIALRTSEQAGNFVLDQFLVTTRSTSNQANEGMSIAVVTDPGKGYINGYRVETFNNYVINVDKGIDSRNASNLSASINYGNYILVNQIAGEFNFNSGTTVDLYDSSRGYVSNSSLVDSGSISASGTKIGTAQIRSVVYDSGQVGTSSAIYRVYLFNIQMNKSTSFSSVRSIFYNGSIKGIADVVLSFDATTGKNIAMLQDASSNSSLVISSGSDATNNISNLNYIYRMVDESVIMETSGIASALLSSSEESFAYESSALTDNEMNELLVVPTETDIVLQVNATSNGTATVSTSSNVVNVTISSTINKYSVGDFIALYSNTSSYVVRRITGKTSNTFIVDSNVGFTLTGANFSKVFPQYVPIPLSRIDSSTVLLTNNNKTMTINLGVPLQNSNNVPCVVTYDVKVTNATPKAKTANRDLFVKLCLANNSALTKGPWCLGVPDTFRLKNVYLSNNSTVNTNSTDVTEQFYLDHNQTTDYYGLGYLYLVNNPNIKLNSNNYLLVQFDAFTSAAGVYTINSYVSSNNAQRFADDSLSLGDLGSKVNSFEIPEFYASNGKHYDLINCIDFRPIVANTANLSTTIAGATLNPSSTINFGSNNKKFPLPDSGVSFSRSYFLGRKDTVVINTSNQINIVRGTPKSSQPYPDPTVPPNSIVLKKLIIPSYPSLPEVLSANTSEILDRKMSNGKLLLQRISSKTVTSQTSNTDISSSQPRVYTMSDIGQLDRRISDLEYTVSLSLVESDLKDKVIPSSVDPAANRFKFGFFVDDYSTDKNSDITNPEYQADVLNSRVSPVSESTLITHGKGYRLADWVSQTTIINQNLASAPPAPVVVSPPPPNKPPVVVTPSPAPPSKPAPSPAPQPAPAPPPPVVVPPPPKTTPTPSPTPTPTPTPIVTAKSTSVYRSSSNMTLSQSDDFRVTMSSVAGTFTVNYNFFGNKDSLYVVKILSNGNEQVLYSQNIKKTGVLTFQHDPSTGRNYAFRVISHSSKWQYTLSYPIDSTTFVDTVPPSTNVNSIVYSGTVVSLTPGYVSPSSLKQTFTQSYYISQGAMQRVSLAGLKPNTKHTITSSNHSAKMTVNQINSSGVVGSNTSTITSDASGKAVFDIMITNLTQTNSYIESNRDSSGNFLTNILIQLTSSDHKSGANFYLYAKTGVTATTVPSTSSVVNTTTKTVTPTLNPPNPKLTNISPVLIYKLQLAGKLTDL